MADDFGSRDSLQNDPAQRGDPASGPGPAERIEAYVRSPQDVLRVIAFGVVTIALTAMTIGFEDGIVGVEEDIVELFGFFDAGVERVLHGAVEVVAGLVALATLVVPLVARRWRVTAYVVAASFTAVVAMSLCQRLIDRETSATLVNELAERAGIADSGTTSGSVGLAQLAAVFVVLGPFVSRRWRRAGACLLAVLFLARILVTVRLPIELFLSLPVGALCGAATLLAFGRPERRPTSVAIRDALVAAGLDVVDVAPASVDARGSQPSVATLADDSRVFVKVLGAHERAADLMFRGYRFLRLKNVGDERAFSSLRRTIEHEALVALLARDVGVRTPRLRAITDVGVDSMLLAFDLVDARPLSELPDTAVTDEVMRRVWLEVAALRGGRIAHRDLRRSNVLIAADGTPWLIDFGFSEVAVDPSILSADVAQLLVSFALVAGPERSVGAAVESLGRGPVAEAMPRLQRRALSGATQEALKPHRGLLEATRAEVMRQTEAPEVEMVVLERANRSTIVTGGALVLATYFLFPQLTNLPGIVDQVRDASWSWTPLILLASAGTYVAASMSLAGSVPNRLPSGPLLLASVGSSFAGTLAPASVGGMALNLRFFQKQGVDRAVAVSGVGLDAVGGVIGHLSLIAVFFVWAGRDAFDSVSLPDPHWLLVGLAVVVVLGAAAFAVPATRRLVRQRVLSAVMRAADGIVDVVRNPGKVALLLGGSVLVTLFYLLTCWFSLEAFGGGVPFATVGAVFLVALAIATAAPTPGGLGAMEAALIAGLVSAGLDNTVAVPAVFMYRLFTFWIPILPGWFAFRWLERHDYL